MPDIDDDPVDYDEAAAVGFKVVEMADRVKVADKVMPGSVARWSFEIDDVKFDVSVTVHRGG